jgi:hypothetical protein
MLVWSRATTLGQYCKEASEISEDRQRKLSISPLCQKLRTPPHLISKLLDPLVLGLYMGGKQSKLTPLQSMLNIKKRIGTYNLCSMLNIKSVVNLVLFL